MTKADRIRELAKQKLTDAEIQQIVAKEFGSCRIEYVRVCARQRLGAMSAADAAYVERVKNRTGLTPWQIRYRRDPKKYSAAASAYVKRRRATDAAYAKRLCEQNREWRSRFRKKHGMSYTWHRKLRLKADSHA